MRSVDVASWLASGLLVSLGISGCSSSSGSVVPGASSSGGSSSGGSSGGASCQRELSNANYNCNHEYCVPTGAACDARGTCPGTCSSDPSGISGARCKLDSDCAVGMLCLNSGGHDCAGKDGCTCAASPNGSACATPADCAHTDSWSCYNPNGSDDGCGPDGGAPSLCWCQCNGCSL